MNDTEQLAHLEDVGAAPRSDGLEVYKSAY